MIPTAALAAMGGNQTSIPQMEVAPSKPKAKSRSVTDKKKIVDWAQKQYDVCTQPRLAFEQQWYMNMAFYFGKHYAAWVPGASGSLTRLYEPAAPPYRVRLTVNKCRRIVRTELTKVTRQTPQFYVIPNTTDESDRMAAQAAEEIAEYELRELHYNAKLRSAAHWTTICGTGFLKTYWDASKLDPSGIPGSNCIDAVTPFHIYVPDIQEEDIEGQPYVIHTMLLDKEYVNQTFGVDVQNNSEVRGGTLEQRFFSALGIKSNQPAANKVQCFEIWVKPCPKYPEGALILWTGKELLQFQDSWPYVRTDFPFAKIDHIPTGRFYGDSALVDLIPLQRELNRSHSQIIEAKNKMAKPQWTAQKGSVDANKMTSEPGLVIQFTPGFQEPHPVQPPSLPTYVIDELERLGREMDDLAATGEITKGNVPPGITAASAISYLQEENDNRFAPTVSSIEAATEKVGKWVLSFVNEYWDASRQIKVVGDNRLTAVREFSKSDIAGNTDFCVETGSAAPRSRAARQAFIIELRKMGSIDDQKMLKYLDMVETSKLYMDSRVDDNQVQRENVMMNSGQPVPVNPFDNIPVHIQGHGDYMKTEEYSSLDPQIQQIHLNHWLEHKNQAVMEMQQQQMMQQAATLPTNGQAPAQGQPPVSQRSNNGSPQ